MVAKKDVHMPTHPELADKNVPSLRVMKAVQSEVLRLSEGAVGLETFLLVPYDRGKPGSQRWPLLTSGERACHFVP